MSINISDPILSRRRCRPRRSFPNCAMMSEDERLEALSNFDYPFWGCPRHRVHDDSQ
jgi:hypothetical protein